MVSSQRPRSSARALIRPRSVAIASTAAAVALSGLLVPASAEPSASTSLANAADGQITPEMQSEIDRVVAEGKQQTTSTSDSATAMAKRLIRCADFEGQTYCLHTGWTTNDEATAQQEATTTVASEETATASSRENETTGDATLTATLAKTASLSPAKRAKQERAELREAAESVGKVWLLRHEIQGEPLPKGFFADHPEALAMADADTVASPESATEPMARKRWRDYPQSSVLAGTGPRKGREQTRSYWCGPTAMQMVALSWSKRDRGQRYWASKLGTTTSGTAITEMVRVTNQNTGWDGPNYAGKYITLDIGDWTYLEWWLLQMRHLEDYKAPVILHPILLKRYYPYLDDDASGHFQMARGYDKKGNKPNKLSYYEPWNQQRFDPSEPHIARIQWRAAYRSYLANQAHFQHNIGV